LLRAERMNRALRIKTAIETQFAPERLDIVDDSGAHAGHHGSSAAGETHFSVTVVSAAFEGLRPVDRQRQVYATLAEEFKAGLHALDLRVLTPSEARKP
jgi:BolA family transcriptional regulator, general stress-responsive regulator